MPDRKREGARSARSNISTIMMESDMTSLLDAAHLDGRFFDGNWIEGDQGYDVLEPATGSVLARAASVDPATVARTAMAARAAQQDWAAATSDVRAGVFVQAAALARPHGQAIGTWIILVRGSCCGNLL